MGYRRSLLVTGLFVAVASVSGFVAARPRHDKRHDEVERAAIVADVKRQLAAEMGLMPVRLLRDRRASFVELYSDDRSGASHYGTAGYLGDGYFITVKHAVVALGPAASPITSLRVVYKGGEIPTRVVDTGDARGEVQRGDWAIISTTPLDLPALTVDTHFAFEFAAPIVRLGNDYSKGVLVSSGYVGQHIGGGLVTGLLDGHPGVSGGGVLSQNGDLVGIPVGRMDGDYRFSFLLPVRAEMFRKVPRTTLD